MINTTQTDQEIKEKCATLSSIIIIFRGNKKMQLENNKLSIKLIINYTHASSGVGRCIRAYKVKVLFVPSLLMECVL